MHAFVAAALLTAAVPAGQAVFDGDVIVVAGDLGHHRATNELFHVHKLWMQVAPDSLFHRWLMDGDDQRVAVILTTRPELYGDRRGARILTGVLHHGTAPATSPLVHILTLQDEATGTFGPITFETDDAVTARKFEPFDGKAVSVIIEFQ